MIASGCLPATSEEQQDTPQLLLPSFSFCLGSPLLTQCSGQAKRQDKAPSTSFAPTSPQMLDSNYKGALPIPVLNSPPVNLRTVHQVVLLIALQRQLLGVVCLVVIQGNDQGFFMFLKWSLEKGDNKIRQRCRKELNCRARSARPRAVTCCWVGAKSNTRSHNPLEVFSETICLPLVGFLYELGLWCWISHRDVQYLKFNTPPILRGKFWPQWIPSSHMFFTKVFWFLQLHHVTFCSLFARSITFLSKVIQSMPNHVVHAYPIWFVGLSES